MATQAVAGEVSGCLIEPNQTVGLGSPVTGVLEEVAVRRADRVTKGQVVARIESRVEKAASELARFKSAQTGPTSMAESKIAFSRKKFERRKVMAEEKVMSAQASDDAEAELRVAQAELKVAQENRQIAGLEYRQQKGLLDLRTLRSPFSGVVVEQAAYPGEVVEPGKGVILKLAELDPLRIQVVLHKGAFGKVTPQMQVEILPEIPANGRYTARVRSVDRLIDAASGTFVVILELPNPDLRIPAGVTCKARFPDSVIPSKTRPVKP
ncbi:MAG: efflux RND transporter periplasmic adaptor subunit [Zoogloeaceae bacterium]|jgi:RND family efflux transporter MFP subunit|nr:efflux RND transporter periplasmic adaptor subunit [Zoogloeaceae bacterium]